MTPAEARQCSLEELELWAEAAEWLEAEAQLDHLRDSFTAQSAAYVGGEAHEQLQERERGLIAKLGGTTPPDDAR